MDHASSRIYARTIYENSEIGRIGYGLCLVSCLLNMWKYNENMKNWEALISISYNI